MPCMATCHCSLLASPQQLAHVHAWVCMLCERMLRHRVADRLESSYPAGCRATGPPALQLCHAAAYGASSCCAILPSANNGYTLQINFRTSYFKKISCGSPTPTSPAASASLPATASSQRCRCRGLNEQRRPHHTTLQHLHSGTVVADLAAGFGRACYL